MTAAPGLVEAIQQLVHAFRSAGLDAPQAIVVHDVAAFSAAVARTTRFRLLPGCNGCQVLGIQILPGDPPPGTDAGGQCIDHQAPPP